MLILLKTLTDNSSFYVPELFIWTPPDTLTMEYCNGLRLRDLPQEQLPDATLWSQLFDLLYEIQQMSWASLSPVLQTALEGQYPIWDCMRRWKTNRTSFVEPPHACLCLGDVSLNNLLYDGQRICLLDFECAHWGCSGYDGGLLLAAAESWWEGQPVLGNLMDGFHFSRGDESWKQDCLAWRARLWDFYDKNRAVCP